MSNNDPSKITSITNEGRSESKLLSFLRAVSLIALVVAATGSLGFMFRAGQHSPRLLLILFTIWVLTPFVALFWANTVSQHWSVPTRATLHCVMLIVALGSLAIYGKWVDITPPGSANAALFVAVPPLSLLLIIIVVPIARFLAGRFSRRGKGN